MSHDGYDRDRRTGRRIETGNHECMDTKRALTRRRDSQDTIDLWEFALVWCWLGKTMHSGMCGDLVSL